MTEEIIKSPEKPVAKPEAPKQKVLCIGCDIGTMNIVCSRNDSDEIKLMRNVFLELNPDEVSISDLSDIKYVENDGNIFIIGNDAFRLANIFGREVSRPMEKGLISSKEINAIDVLTIMLKDLIGDIKDKDSYVSYSIPAESIDEGRSVTYHEKVFGRILSALGLNHKPINEAMAIIYSECEKEKFSGIGISFGAGMCNCLDGNTKIPLLDGSIKTIKELSMEKNAVWVYSCKDDGTIVPGLAHSARFVGIKPIIRIYLDNETYFDCTEDHPLMLRDGTYVEAKDLKTNDSLMPLYLKESNIIKGYVSCYHNKHKHWELVHNMVVRESYGVYRKKGYVVHHKNFNKKDNRPENLNQIEKNKHFLFHKEVAKLGGKVGGKIIQERTKGKTYKEIYGEEKTGVIIKNIIEGVRRSSAKTTLRKQRLNKKFEEIFGTNKSIDIKKKMILKKKNLKFEQIMNNNIELINKRKANQSKQCKKQQLWTTRKTKINNGTFQKGQIPWNKGMKGEDYLNHFIDGVKNQYINHKVLRIEKLNICSEVFDMTVDKYNNFAINNGIFVHNCGLAYKGIETFKFSTSRSGDWVDKNVADSLNMIKNRVTSIKEKYFNLHEGFEKEQNKKIRRVLESLTYFYGTLIEYTIKRIIQEFNDNMDTELEEPIPIIVSGGTSLPPGFLDLFKNIITKHQLPFEISEIRSATNPLTAVSQGLLIKTISDFSILKNK